MFKKITLNTTLLLLAAFLLIARPAPAQESVITDFEEPVITQIVEYGPEVVKVPKDMIEVISINQYPRQGIARVVMSTSWMDITKLNDGYWDWASKRRKYSLNPNFPRLFFDESNVIVQNAAQPGIADEISIRWLWADKSQGRLYLYATFDNDVELDDFLNDFLSSDFVLHFDLLYSSETYYRISQAYRRK